MVSTRQSVNSEGEVVNSWSKQEIHCYEPNNPHTSDETMFRDYLKMNREAFEKYKKVKLEASEKYRFSSAKYTEYKSQCVNEILEEARIYYNECF